MCHCKWLARKVFGRPGAGGQSGGRAGFLCRIGAKENFPGSYCSFELFAFEEVSLCNSRPPRQEIKEKPQKTEHFAPAASARREGAKRNLPESFCSFLSRCFRGGFLFHNRPPRPNIKKTAEKSRISASFGPGLRGLHNSSGRQGAQKETSLETVSFSD